MVSRAVVVQRHINRGSSGGDLGILTGNGHIGELYLNASVAGDLTVFNCQRLITLLSLIGVSFAVGDVDAGGAARSICNRAVLDVECVAAKGRSDTRQNSWR